MTTSSARDEPQEQQQNEMPTLEFCPPRAAPKEKSGTMLSLASPTKKEKPLVAPATVAEPYLTLKEIADRYSESRINVPSPEESAGLSIEEVEKRQVLHGKNCLTPPKKKPEILVFLSQFLDLFMVLLNVAGLLSLVTYFLDQTIPLNLYVALVLYGVMILNGTMSYWQERSTGKVMDTFKNMLPPSCNAIRNGQSLVLPASELVVGDLVWVRNGDKVPADLRLICCMGLKAECSSLTGEPEPIQLTDSPQQPDTPVLECKNLAFNGSLCFDGAALGLVISTGDKTMIGKIAALASSTHRRESNLQREVTSFVRFVAVLALTMAVTFFTLGVVRMGEEHILSVFITGFLVIIIANVPQGLPATVTSIMTITARRMARNNVYVKRLGCVETLGSTTLIATDKTGTLTQNKMTLTNLWYANEFVERRDTERLSEHVRLNHGGEPIDFLRSMGPAAALYRAACLCNRAEPKVMTPAGTEKSQVLPLAAGRKREFTGNPSDVALITFAELQYSVEYTREKMPVLFEIPFNSMNKWQLIITLAPPAPETSQAPASGPEIGAAGETQRLQIIMKGAPEVILRRCTSFLDHDASQQPISPAFQDHFKMAYERFGSEGRRVLALAQCEFDSPKDAKFSADSNSFPTEGLCFVGLVAIMDPPRDNVPAAIKSCHQAGIKVFMVTGDHPITAKAIAQQIGLLDGENIMELLEGGNPAQEQAERESGKSFNGAVVHGARVDGLSQAEWDDVLSKKAVVFARTTPQHKLKIVEQCQARGETVAVTGDGVNDAPALKQADVGVAMGRNGSEVARESADIVLVDDNFSSIVWGVEQGRLMYDNLKKTVAYTLAHLWGEILPVVIHLAAGMPYGLTALQILSIDLGTELAPAISIAYERPERDIMKRPPRDPKRDRLVSWSLLFYAYMVAGVIEGLGCFLSYCFAFWAHDIPINELVGSDDYWHPKAEKFCISSGRCFDAEEQMTILGQATSSWYITLVMSQAAHIWMCKTRRVSFLKHGFGNVVMFYGVIIETCLVIILVYVPFLQEIMGSGTIGYVPWVVAVCVGALLWLYNEVNKYYTRNTPPDQRGPVRNLLAW